MLEDVVGGIVSGGFFTSLGAAAHEYVSPPVGYAITIGGLLFTGYLLKEYGFKPAEQYDRDWLNLLHSKEFLDSLNDYELKE